jgi:hypothetical protein
VCTPHSIIQDIASQKPSPVSRRRRTPRFFPLATVFGLMPWRRARAQPHAGAGPPEIRPHHLTLDRVGVPAPDTSIRATQRHQHPFGIGQIARVAQAVSIRSRSMVRLPQQAPLPDSGAAHGITTGSRDATSSRMGSEDRAGPRKLMTYNPFSRAGVKIQSGCFKRARVGKLPIQGSVRKPRS